MKGGSVKMNDEPMYGGLITWKHILLPPIVIGLIFLIMELIF